MWQSSNIGFSPFSDDSDGSSERSSREDKANNLLCLL
jgi:hypothetical protein